MVVALWGVSLVYILAAAMLQFQHLMAFG